MKKTRTREVVLNILEKSSTPMSAYDIFESVKDEKITLSSIYRTLSTFHDKKMVIKDSINGTAVYTILKDTHHHYLECNICHKKIMLDYCPYHKVNEQIYKKLNFKVDEHNVVLYGTCEDCNKKQSYANTKKC